MQRKFLLIPAFLVLLLVVVPLFIDFSKYATPYLSDAQKIIGRNIRIGTIRLQILPTPRINIHNVALGNAPNTQESEMVTVKNIEVILSLMDILRGKITIKSVSLNTPTITLEKNKAGQGNWEIQISPNEKQQVKAPSNAIETTAGAFVINHFEANNTTITYIDHKDNSSKSFSNLKIQCDSEKLTGPYKIFVQSEGIENNIDLEILTGDFSSGITSLMAGITLNLKEHRIKAELSGSLDINKKHFSGKLTASSFALPFTLELPNYKIDLHKAIEVQAKLHTTPEHITITNLQATHPIGQIIGDIHYNFLTELCDINLKFKHKKSLINLQCSTNNFHEFTYHLSSSSYQEIMNWFTKESLVKDPIHLKGLLKIEKDAISCQKAMLSIGEAKAEGDIHFNTATQKTKITALLNALQKWGKILNQDLPISGPATISLKTFSAKEHTGISAKLSLNKASAFFEGIIGTGELLTKGKINLKHLNLSDYMINMKSDILIKKNEINMNIQNVELKNKTGINFLAGGTVLIDLSKEKPHLAGSLTAQPVQLTKFENNSIQILQTLYTPQISGFKLSQIANINSRWSSAPINLPLNTFTMTLHISVPKITISDFVFEELQSDINLKAGKLNIPFSAHMYGGKITGSLLAQLANSQSISLSTKFSNIDLAKVKVVAAHFSKGQASGSIDLHTQGISQHEWVSRLTGQTSLSIKNGMIKGFDLRSIVNILKKPSNLLNLSTIQNFFNGKGVTNFAHATSSFIINNGIAKTNDIFIDATDAQLKAQGHADLLRWNIQFVGQILLPALKIPPLEFTIKGPLDEPSYNLNLKSLQSLLFGNEAGNLVSKAIGKSMSGIEKILPGLSTSRPKKDTNSEKTESSQPEKIAKGILKNIFK